MTKKDKKALKEMFTVAFGVFIFATFGVLMFSYVGWLVRLLM